MEGCAAKRLTHDRRFYAARPEKGAQDRKLIPLNGSSVSFYSSSQENNLSLWKGPEGQMPTHNAQRTTARHGYVVRPSSRSVTVAAREEDNRQYEGRYEIFMHFFLHARELRAQVMYKERKKAKIEKVLLSVRREREGEGKGREEKRKHPAKLRGGLERVRLALGFPFFCPARQLETIRFLTRRAVCFVIVVSNFFG
jgi:hypothetical protein